MKKYILIAAIFAIPTLTQAYDDNYERMQAEMDRSRQDTEIAHQHSLQFYQQMQIDQMKEDQEKFEKKMEDERKEQSRSYQNY